MSLKHRVKKLEQKNSIGENPVTKIVVEYIDMEGKVSGTTVKKLIAGVWVAETDAPIRAGMNGYYEDVKREARDYKMEK